MINAAKGKNIIDAMAKGTSVSFATPYVGLFKTMPGANGNGGMSAKTYSLVLA